MDNVEQIVVEWLPTVVGLDWPVSGDKPDGQQPMQYILVDRTGGPREAMVLDRAEILIEVYHKTSRITASNLANIISDRIHELKTYENITTAKINSLTNLDDPIAGYSRYQIYCDISCRR